MSKPAGRPAAVPLASPGDMAVKLASLRERLYGRITGDVLDKVVDTMIRKAEDGNVGAARFVVELVTQPGPAAAVAVQVTNNTQTNVMGGPLQVGQLRKLVGGYLLANRTASVMAVARFADLSIEAAEVVVAHEWFVSDGNGEVTLSAAGRRVFG